MLKKLSKEELKKVSGGVNIKELQKRINALPDGEHKIQIQSHLDNIKNAIKAHDECHSIYGKDPNLDGWLKTIDRYLNDIESEISGVES